MSSSSGVCSAWAVKDAQDHSSINLGKDLFWASLLDQQASSSVFDGRLQIRDALEDKPRRKRTGLHMSQRSSDQRRSSNTTGTTSSL